MIQPMLFDHQPSEAEPLFAPESQAGADAPVFIPQTDVDGTEWGDFDSCLAEFRTNHCALDGELARIVGTPRTAQYATIEPIDLDAEPMRCCWDVVDMVMQDGGAFCREDDDTDE
jgi:hypothetical protein